jgi:hypothetical protein
LKQGNRLNHRRRLDPINSRNHTRSYHRWKFLKQELVSQEFLKPRMHGSAFQVVIMLDKNSWFRNPWALYTLLLPTH